MKNNSTFLSGKFPAKSSPHVSSEMEYHNQNAEKLIKTSKQDLIWQVPEKIFFIDQYLDNKSNWVWLDLGCGPAINIKRNLIPLIKKNDKYIGVDISDKLLSEAKKEIPKGIFIHSSMKKIEIEKESVDYVSFFGALHHEEKPEITIKFVSKLLKSGGYFFLREPHIKAFEKGKGSSPMESGFDPKILRKYLTDNGLQILEWHYSNTIPWHFFRRVINKLSLKQLENYVLFWQFKTRLELLLEGVFVGKLVRWQGTDMYIVARKTG
jgi:SAM-dependent methyltransferase